MDPAVVARLGTVFADVTMLVTVATDEDTLFRAVGGSVTFLLAVAARHFGLGGAVAREVTHLAATLALNSFGRAGLSAVRSFVTRLLAIAASIAILADIGTVADIVAKFLAVVALDLWLLDLSLLLWTAAGVVANLLTVEALLDHRVHDEAGRLKALKILFLGLGVPGGKLCTLRLEAVLERDDKLLVWLTL